MIRTLWYGIGYIHDLLYALMCTGFNLPLLRCVYKRLYIGEKAGRKFYLAESRSLAVLRLFY